MLLELIKISNINCKKYPKWREGQCWFNSLCELKPELANEIRGDDSLDPFYQDENIPNFIYWVEQKEIEND